MSRTEGEGGSGERWSPPPRQRQIFCNRTLNLRSIHAIGYDMDYTLVHYRVEDWERQAYLHLQFKLIALGLPAENLEFEPELVTRGLMVDKELGNLIKANRFGYVTRASHGTRALDFETQRQTYGRVVVDPQDSRYAFLNTLFALSEACMYAQLVDRLDGTRLARPVGYTELYKMVRQAMDEAHVEGELKAEIVSRPEWYVERDPEMVTTLLDQKAAGKKLLLITNSEWKYTREMMSFAVDPFLPEGSTWRDLFELVIVSARKPDFFMRTMPMFRLVTEEGLLEPCEGGIREPGVYLGGDAGQVQTWLGMNGDQVLYVGDHIYVDVHVSKNVLRWRTALILRELEAELDAQEGHREDQEALERLMARKARLEFRAAQARLQLQRVQERYGQRPEVSPGKLKRTLSRLRGRIESLDETIAPMAQAANELLNDRWGLLMRAGNDKSHMARQVERYADIYTSRVSNFLFETPFGYLRAPRGGLPHDDDVTRVR